MGRYLMDRPHDPLFTLAHSVNPHERRTAITAPLFWARYGTPAHLPDLFRLAEVLLGDEPALLDFLNANAGRMQRPAFHYAVEKLTPAQRARLR